MCVSTVPRGRGRFNFKRIMPSILIGQTKSLEFRDAADSIVSPPTQQLLPRGAGQPASLRADGADQQSHFLQLIVCSVCYQVSQRGLDALEIHGVGVKRTLLSRKPSLSY